MSLLTYLDESGLTNSIVRLILKQSYQFFISKKAYNNRELTFVGNLILELRQEMPILVFFFCLKVLRTEQINLSQPQSMQLNNGSLFTHLIEKTLDSKQRSHMSILLVDRVRKNTQTYQKHYQLYFFFLYFFQHH